MTDRHSRKETSTGHGLSEGSYLDSHFETMRPEYEAMIRSVGLTSGWSVLDAGCGGGSFLPLLAAFGRRKGPIFVRLTWPLKTLRGWMPWWWKPAKFRVPWTPGWAI